MAINGYPIMCDICDTTQHQLRMKTIVHGGIGVFDAVNGPLQTYRSLCPDHYTDTLLESWQVCCNCRSDNVRLIGLSEVLQYVSCTKPECTDVVKCLYTTPPTQLAMRFNGPKCVILAPECRVCKAKCTLTTANAIFSGSSPSPPESRFGRENAKLLWMVCRTCPELQPIPNILAFCVGCSARCHRRVVIAGFNTLHVLACSDTCLKIGLPILLDLLLLTYPTLQPLVCAWCDMLAEKLSRCGCCKQARYCSKECQLAHWSRHKIVCHPAAICATDDKPVMFQELIKLAQMWTFPLRFAIINQDRSTAVVACTANTLWSIHYLGSEIGIRATKEMLRPPTGGFSSQTMLATLTLLGSRYTEGELIDPTTYLYVLLHRMSLQRAVDTTIKYATRQLQRFSQAGTMRLAMFAAWLTTDVAYVTLGSKNLQINTTVRSELVARSDLKTLQHSINGLRIQYCELATRLLAMLPLLANIETLAIVPHTNHLTPLAHPIWPLDGPWNAPITMDELTRHTTRHKMHVEPNLAIRDAALDIVYVISSDSLSNNFIMSTARYDEATGTVVVVRELTQWSAINHRGRTLTTGVLSSIQARLKGVPLINVYAFGEVVRARGCSRVQEHQARLHYLIKHTRRFINKQKDTPPLVGGPNGILACRRTVSQLALFVWWITAATVRLWSDNQDPASQTDASEDKLNALYAKEEQNALCNLREEYEKFTRYIAEEH